MNKSARVFYPSADLFLIVIGLGSFSLIWASYSVLERMLSFFTLRLNPLQIRLEAKKQ